MLPLLYEKDFIAAKDTIDITGDAFCFGGNNTIITLLVYVYIVYLQSTSTVTIIDLPYNLILSFFRGFALMEGLALIDFSILCIKQDTQYVVVVVLQIEQSKPIKKNAQNSK
jgi:hypothetical protein